MTDTVKVSSSLDLGPLSDELLPIARSQGEDPDRTSKYLEELRNLIFEKGDFQPHRTDDDFLMKFLRARFFKVEDTFILLQRYHEFRESNQDLYVNVNPFLFSHLGYDDIVSITPYYDQNGRRTFFFKVRNWKPSEVPANDLLKAALFFLEMASLEPQAQVLGVVGIFDLEGLTLNHAMTVTPSVVSKIICLLATCTPVRTNCVHIINQSWVFNMIFKMFKPFLNEKMRSKIFFHGTDMASLHNHIDKERLPIKYGGYMEDYPHNTLMANLKQTQLRELQQLGYSLKLDDNDSELKIE